MTMILANPGLLYFVTDNLAIGPKVSLFPQVGLAYQTVSATMTAGPQMEMSKIEDQDGEKTTSMGLSTTIGGWF